MHDDVRLMTDASVEKDEVCSVRKGIVQWVDIDYICSTTLASWHSACMHVMQTVEG